MVKEKPRQTSLETTRVSGTGGKRSTGGGATRSHAAPSPDSDENFAKGAS